jgi:cell volume regulation protein A
VFKKYSNLTLKLAFLGIIINTIIIGLAASFLFGLDLGLAMLLGAVLSGTETGVIVAFQRSLAKSKEALSIINVESIFNSPFSVLIPLMVLDLIMITPGAMIEPMKYMSQFWLMITAGVGTGIIVGLGVTKVFKGALKEYTPLMLLAIALISYALATGVGGSGMLAVAVCGLVAGNFSIHGKEEKEGIIQFQDQFSEMLRIAVFTLLGAQVSLLMTLPEFGLVLAFFLISVASRPLMLLLMMGDLKKKFSTKDILIMSFIAPRGLSSAAMIPILFGAVVTAGRPELGSMMVNAVFLFILMSVVFSSVVAKIAGMEEFPFMKKGKKEGKGAKEKDGKGKEEKEESALVKDIFGKGDLSSMIEIENKEDKGTKKKAKKKGGK